MRMTIGRSFKSEIGGTASLIIPIGRFFKREIATPSTRVRNDNAFVFVSKTSHPDISGQ